MPETTTAATELASQYITRVSSDLESNIKEQERVSAEIAALQEQLTALQHDHGVLLNMQQALGITILSTKPETQSEAETPARVVSPRRKKTSTTTGAKRKAGTSAATTPKTDATAATKSKTKTVTTQAKPKAAAAAAEAKPQPTTTAAQAKPKAGKSGASPVRKAAGESAFGAAGGAEASQPTLVELIRRHLAEQQEPRSAAEISAALGQARPGRTVSAKVVRITLEGLVAKSQAQRSKQGRSVFYVAPASRPTAAPDAEAEAQHEAADH